jgi:hypothetical protein
MKHASFGELNTSRAKLIEALICREHLEQSIISTRSAPGFLDCTDVF